MSRRDLPQEVHRRPLDYEQLVSTLHLIDGEHVIVRIAPRDDDDNLRAGGASIVGVLRHQIAARGEEFSIGTPYPDLQPEHVVGGILFIRRRTFESAALTTFDGNDYFIVSIKTHAMDILVQDSDSTYP